MRQSETSGVLPIDAARTDRRNDRGAADALPTLPTDASAAQSSQVLIVEDESIVALNLKHMLQRLGYSVVGIAHASAEALDLAATGRPDVVLMDINLGAGWDGIETAAMIAAHGDPAVIYLTAYSEPATLARAQKTRPYGYLLKPFSEQELHATLQMTLERHRLDRLLAQSERRLTLALDAARMGTWDLSAGGETVQCSAATGAMIGPAGAPLVDSWARFLERVVPEDRSAVDAASTDTVVNGVPLHVEFRGDPVCGESRWIRLQGRRYDADSSSEVIGVAQDVTDSRNGELALRRAAAVFDAITEPIFIADAQLRLTTVNAAFVAVTGQPAADVVGRVLDGWLLQSAVGQRLPDLASELATHGQWRGEVVALRRAGEAFSAWLNATAITDAAGAMTQVVVILSDIGTLRRAEADLIHAAHHDTLTGLPNRILAMDRLEQAIGRAKRKDWRCVVMMVDLDHLKHVNDGFGHAAGDEFLCAAASRMRETLRSEDTVARLGGDEFIVVLDNIERTSDVAILAAKMLTRLADPLMVGGSELRSSASMGISVFPDDAQDPAALVVAADTAMFVAKQEGRGRFAFFKPQMGHRLSRRAAAIGDLRRGLAAGELEVHYQPQVSLTDMRLTGLEALVRWQHPERGLLGAAEIVPLAEENGLIVEVGAFVIGSACRQIRQWLDAGLSCPRVAVNVSVKQLRSRAFAPAVEAILGEHAVPAALIELELTESTLQQENVCMPAMQALASLGMALAIDDFGTGYSSLNSLRHLPVGRVKIDRCFINEIASHTSDAAITEAIIELGHRLGMRITAEGVETTAQLEVLRHLGCDEVQGYLIARPMPVEALHALLRESESARCTSPAYWQAFERSAIDAKPVPSSR